MSGPAEMIGEMAPAMTAAFAPMLREQREAMFMQAAIQGMCLGLRPMQVERDAESIVKAAIRIAYEAETERQNWLGPAPDTL